jgi:hypothetical protein
MTRTPRPNRWPIVGAAALTIALAACSGQSAVAPAVPGSGLSNANAVKAPAVHPADDPPIQLVIGTTVGQSFFPEGDTATGGQGQQIDHVFNCMKALDGPSHHHVHLSIFNNGQQIAVPRGIGMLNPGHNKFIYHQTCLYWLHSHDDTGILHMEPKIPTATFTLGNAFDLWGEPLDATTVAGFTGPQLIIVNGATYTGDPRAILFTPFMQITIEVGTPLPGPPPTYLFPPDYT